MFFTELLWKKVENYVENRELEIRTLQKSKKPEKEVTDKENNSADFKISNTNSTH